MAIRVGVIMGGYSSEHGISLKSGQAVFKALDAVLFEAYSVVQSKTGWSATNAQGTSIGFDPARMAILHEGAVKPLELIFNLIHGHPGEDGTLAITWEALGIPYTSCPPASSALTFHKAWTNGVVQRLGVPVAPAIWTHDGVDPSSLDLKGLQFPLFVKPCRSGSSYGVTRITEAHQLADALKEAAKEDHAIVIEQGVSGTEVGCGVARWEDEVHCLGITEIVPKREFFDYSAKYEGLAEEITPARIPAGAALQIEDYTRRIYEGLGLTGFCRADFILPKKGPPVLIEINTVPGMSQESILPKQLAARGTSLTEFTTLLAHQALKDSKNRAFPGIF